MIFNKKFEDIAFDDIQAMVDEKYPENIILDYKREFNNKDAAKVVSAFANTYGGYLIFGVEEEKDTNKPDFICGLLEDEKVLESKLVNTTIDRISPYVACNTKVLYNKDKSLKVLLVKVPESDLSPHGVEQNTKWYIRLNDRKKLIDRPDFEKLEWLKNRRVKFVQFRSEVLSRIETRMQTAFNVHTGNEIYLETLVMPMFPKEQLVSIYDFNEFILREVKAFSSTHSARFNMRDSKRVNDGIFMYADYGGIAYALELNCFGFCFVKTKMKKYGDPKPAYVQTESLCTNLITGIMLGIHILRAVDYRGSIILHSSLSEIQNSLIADTIPGYGHLTKYSQLVCKGANSLNHKTICQSQDYEGHVKSHIEEFLANFFYLYEVNDDLMECSSKLFRQVASNPYTGYVDKFSLN